MDEEVRRKQLAAAIVRVAGGDRAALQLVYHATSAKLFGIVLRILGDRGEAEDVLQDVYLTVWRKAGRFDATVASPITWLVSIARNRAIDRCVRGRSLGALGQSRLPMRWPIPRPPRPRCSRPSRSGGGLRIVCASSKSSRRAQSGRHFNFDHGFFPVPESG